MRKNSIRVTIGLLMVVILSATITSSSLYAASTIKLKKETVSGHPAATKANPPEGLWTDAPYSVPAPLKTAPGFQAGMRAPSTTGTLKALVLMIKFTDQSNDPAHNAAYFINMLFSEANPESMRRYYFENSYGQAIITGYVHPVWLTSSKTMSWYGADSTPGGDDANGYIWELAREAVQLANPAIDFSQYDADSDGVVDHLIMIHAGPDQADTGNPDHIWSHRSMIQPPALIDGVWAEGYTMQAETCPMGVFAHEFGHDLGLPDLYDRDYSSYGVGYWCMMSFGSNLDPPAHFSGWCKLKLGWITPTSITAATTGVVVNGIESSATQSLYKVPITTGSDIEYFLIEHRQPVGFDQSLPGSGVLIWHIDERQWSGVPGEWGQNDDENHKLVDLEEADGLNHLDLQPPSQGNPGDTTDPWYSNPTGFTGTSNPNSDSYSGASTEIKVENISPSGATMTVDFEATQGWTQTAYDDGEPETAYHWTVPGLVFAVRFTPSTSGQLKTASFFIWGIPAGFKVHVLDASRNDLISPLTRTPTSIGWFDVDLSAQGVAIISGVDFYIGMESVIANMPDIGYDMSDPTGRSWDWDGSSWTGPGTDGDYMIRAVVQPIIAYPPPAPILSSPPDGATGVSLTPTLSWSSVSANPAVDYYRLSVWDDASAVLVYMVDFSGTSRVIPLAVLQQGHTYRWAVWAHNSNGYGPASAIWRFVTQGGTPPPSVPSAPTLLGPPDGATDVSLTLTLSWSSVSANPTVDHYRLAIWDDANAVLVYTVDVSDTSQAVPSGVLQSGHTYRWTVWTHNLNGYGPASDIWRFTTG